MKNLTQKLRQVVRHPLLCLFVLFMVFVFCMDMTATNRQFSELENRVLNQRPKFTVEKLVATSTPWITRNMSTTSLSGATNGSP